jgi:hypothetical protein
LFIGGSVACIFVVNTVAFGLYHIPALWSADANTYLVWPPHHYRTPGINLIFVSVHCQTAHLPPDPTVIP